MFLDRSMDQDTTIEKLKQVSSTQFLYNTQYSKQQLRSAFEKLYKRWNRVEIQNTQLKENETGMRTQRLQLYDKLDKLSEHSRALEGECYRMDMLMKENEVKRQQIMDLRKEQKVVKKVCKQLSDELQRLGDVRGSLAKADQEIKRKDQDIRVLIQQLTIYKNKVSTFQMQLQQTQNNLTFVTNKLSSVVIELKKQKYESMKNGQKQEFINDQQTTYNSRYKLMDIYEELSIPILHHLEDNKEKPFEQREIERLRHITERQNEEDSLMNTERQQQENQQEYFHQYYNQEEHEEHQEGLQFTNKIKNPVNMVTDLSLSYHSSEKYNSYIYDPQELDKESDIDQAFENIKDYFEGVMDQCKMLKCTKCRSQFLPTKDMFAQTQQIAHQLQNIIKKQLAIFPQISMFFNKKVEAYLQYKKQKETSNKQTEIQKLIQIQRQQEISEGKIEEKADSEKYDEKSQQNPQNEMKEEKVNYLEQTHKKESQINEEEDHERTIIKKASIVEKVQEKDIFSRDISFETLNMDEKQINENGLLDQLHTVKKQQKEEQRFDIVEEKEVLVKQQVNIQKEIKKKETDSSLIPENVLTLEEQKFMKEYMKKQKFNQQSYEESEVSSNFKWDQWKLYVIDCRVSETGKKDKLILWRNGLISMNYHDGVLMKKTKRVIDDKNMYILGNCEIVAKGRKISLKRSNKKKLFEGSLSDNGWEAENVFIYSLK